jgi:hypothetical protein
MGAGASIPETEEEARGQGYTDRQIDEYKASIQKFAMENAMKALAAHKAQQAQGSASEAKEAEAPRAERESKN